MAREVLHKSLTPRTRTVQCSLAFYAIILALKSQSTQITLYKLTMGQRNRKGELEHGIYVSPTTSA